MSELVRRRLDALIPQPSIIEEHLRALDSERDLLAKLLAVSRDYEARRAQPQPKRPAEALVTA